MRVTMTLSQESQEPLPLPCVNWTQIKASVAALDASGKDGRTDPLEIAAEEGRFCSERDFIFPKDFPLGPAHINVSDVNGGQYPPFRVEVVKSRFLMTTLSSVIDWLPAIAEHAGEDPRSPVDLTHPATPGDVIAITGTGIGVAQVSDISVELGEHSLPAVRIEHREPGVDAILFAIPEETKLEGCYVPLRVTIAGGEYMQTNTATLPVMPARGPCRHPLGLTEEQMAALDTGKLVPLVHLHFSSFGSSPASAHIDSRFMATAEIAELADPETSDEQSLGCRELPYGSVNPPREYGLSHPGGFFDIGAELLLTGPRNEKISIVKDGYTYGARLQEPFAAGEWKLSAAQDGDNAAQKTWQFHLPPSVHFTKLADFEQLEAGNDTEMRWDGSNYRPGEVLAFKFIHSKAARTFLDCVVDATAGSFRINASQLANFSPPYHPLWIVKRQTGRPLAFPLSPPVPPQAVGVVTYQAVQ